MNLKDLQQFPDHEIRVLERQDGSISVYGVFPGGNAHYVIWDSLDVPIDTLRAAPQLAADLAALRSENERLNQIINVRTDDIVERARVMTEQEKALETLRTENARLRELLAVWVARFPIDEAEGIINRNTDYAKLLRNTRAALAHGAKEQTK